MEAAVVRNDQMVQTQAACLGQEEAQVGALHHVLVAGQAVEQVHTLMLVASVVDLGLTILQPVVLCAHQPQMPNASYDSVTQHSATLSNVKAKNIHKSISSQNLTSQTPMLKQMTKRYSY